MQQPEPLILKASGTFQTFNLAPLAWFLRLLRSGIARGHAASPAGDSSPAAASRQGRYSP